MMLVLWALTLPVSAQPLTLEEAIRRAVADNFTVRIARVAETQAERQAEPGNAGYLPTISLNGTGSFIVQQERRQTNQASVNNPALPREIEVYNVQNEVVNFNTNATYTLFNGLQRRNFYRQLQTLAERADWNTRVTLETVVSQVTRAYYDLVQQQQQVRLLEEALGISQERVRIAQERQAVGAGSGLEYLQSTVDLNADRSALLRQRALAQSAAVTLQELMGMRPRLPLEIADTTITVDPDLLVSPADLSGNRQLALLTSDLLAARYATRVARGARWPVLTGTFIYNFNRSEAGPFFQGFNTIPFFNQNFGPTALLGLSVPLFDGNRIRRGIQLAELAERTSELQLGQTSLAVAASLDRTWIDYQTNLELIELEAENADVAARNADVALERFRIGSSTPLELREAQIAFVQAQQRLLAAEFNAKVAQVELLRLTGQIPVN